MTTRNGGGRDHERFRSLYERYYRRIVRFFVRVFRQSEEDAEELTQDVFIRFFEMLDEYRGEAEWALLEKIARSVVLNRIRSFNTAKRGAAIRPVELDDPGASYKEPAAPQEPDYAERKEKTDQITRLRDAIARLPHGQRQCMQLWLAEVPFRAIATTLGISIDAVKSRLRDARRLLRERMGGETNLPEDES